MDDERTYVFRYVNERTGNHRLGVPRRPLQSAFIYLRMCLRDSARRIHAIFLFIHGGAINVSDESAMYLCISKGDVATRSRCGRILNDLLHTNALLLGLDVKESLKIDQLLSKLRQEYSGTLLDNLYVTDLR